MKILHYIPSLDCTSGGTTAYIQLLSKELGRHSDLHIVSHASDNPVELENCQIHFIASWKHIVEMKRQWHYLLYEFKPDIVHINCCWMPGCALTQQWAQQAGYKVVLTPHGMLEPWIMKRHYWTRKVPALLLYQKRAVMKANYLHATAISEKENLLRLGYNNRIEVIANGIDVDNITMKSSWKRNKTILFLSRVHVKKGINFLIEAVAALKDTLNGYRIVVAGEGESEYIRELQLMAEKLGVADICQFAGGVYGDQKWQMLREADLFVLPTHSENFGIVVAEALACGTPVITTQGTPWQELESWHCGWWAKVGTTPTVQALAAFLQKSDSELETMGRNGRRLVEEKYSSRKMAEEMLKLYVRLKSE